MTCGIVREAQGTLGLLLATYYFGDSVGERVPGFFIATGCLADLAGFKDVAIDVDRGERRAQRELHRRRRRAVEVDRAVAPAGEQLRRRKRLGARREQRLRV